MSLATCPKNKAADLTYKDAITMMDFAEVLLILSLVGQSKIEN